MEMRRQIYGRTERLSWAVGHIGPGCKEQQVDTLNHWLLRGGAGAGIGREVCFGVMPRRSERGVAGAEDQDQKQAECLPQARCAARKADAFHDRSRCHCAPATAPGDGLRRSKLKLVPMADCFPGRK